MVLKGMGIYAHTHIHTYTHAFYIFIFFYLALLKKCKKGCNGATKSLQTYIYAVFSGCTHFVKDATRTKI